MLLICYSYIRFYIDTYYVSSTAKMQYNYIPIIKVLCAVANPPCLLPKLPKPRYVVAPARVATLIGG